MAGNRDVGTILLTPSARGEVYGLAIRSGDSAARDVKVRFTPQGAPGVVFEAQAKLVKTPAPDLGLKNYTRAAEILEKAVETSHRGAWPMAKLGVALVHLGRPDEARALLAELEQRAHEATMSAPAVATLQLHLGNRDEFYRWINRGIDERDPFALSLGREFLWSPVWHEPEFQQLLHRVGLA